MRSLIRIGQVTISEEWLWPQDAASLATFYGVKADKAYLLVEKTADSMVLVGEDDGVGFDPRSPKPSEPGHGLGLVGMRERANLIGGEVEAESKPGSGATIYVKVKGEAN